MSPWCRSCQCRSAHRQRVRHDCRAGHHRAEAYRPTGKHYLGWQLRQILHRSIADIFCPWSWGPLHGRLVWDIALRINSEGVCYECILWSDPGSHHPPRNLIVGGCSLLLFNLLLLFYIIFCLYFILFTHILISYQIQ